MYLILLLYIVVNILPKQNQDLDSTVVYIDGKKTTVGEVQKSYAKLSFLSKASAMNIVKTLIKAKDPLTRDKIAKEAKLSVGYTIDLLNKLIEYGYVVPFHIGKRKLIFYAMTEKGYNVLTQKSE